MKQSKNHLLRRLENAKSVLQLWENVYRRMSKISDYRYENNISNSPEYCKKADRIWDRCQVEMAKAQEALRDCKRDYSRRNWDCQDRYVFGLIFDNVD